MGPRLRRRKDPADRGSVLVLAVGLVTILLLGIVVLIDGSAAFLQHRALLSVADSAAIAGAQAIDVAAYYRDGASSATTIDPAAVPARVRALVSRFRDDLPEGLVIEEASSDGRRVRVVLSAPLQLPFREDLSAIRITVVSEAELAYRPGAG
jgi:hypothetical protein